MPVRGPCRAVKCAVLLQHIGGGIGHGERMVRVVMREQALTPEAEEAVQDAFISALETWPERGVPANPGAWITTTARNRAIAEALGVPLNTVRTRISRGRQYIADRVQEQFRSGGSLA